MAKSTALQVFDMPQVPADVMSYFEQESNVKPRVTVNSLSPAGKMWTIFLNGEAIPLMRAGEDGEKEPLSTMRVFILDYAQRRGRTYYAGAYDPDKPGMPICWSDDGIKPPDTVKEKQHPKCDGCPKSIKGSKVTEANKQTTACSQHRMLVVVPASRPDYELLRLKIAITSDYDGQSPDHEAAGWYAFSGYLNLLRARMPTQTHTVRVVTKMRFDPNVTYPKILFSPDRPTKPEELAPLVARLREEKDAIHALLTGTFTPNGVDGVKAIENDDDDEKSEVLTGTPSHSEKTAKDVSPATPAAAKTTETTTQKAAREAKEAYERAMAAAATEAAAAEGGEAGDEEGEIEIEVPAKAAKATAKTPAKAAVNGKAAAKGKAPAPAAAPAQGAVGDGVDDLLANWDA